MTLEIRERLNTFIKAKGLRHTPQRDAIVDVIPDGVMLRIGMTNPPHILEHIARTRRLLPAQVVELLSQLLLYLLYPLAMYLLEML